MSVQAISWVFDHADAHGSERLVLLSIANHADAEGRNSWPGVARIAREANLSESRTKAALRRLADEGVISIERHAGGSRDTRPDRRPNRYTILPLAVVPADDPAGGAGGPRVPPAPTGGAGGAGGANGGRGGSPGGREPSYQNEKKGPAADPVTETLAARDAEHARNAAAAAAHDAEVAAESEADREAARLLAAEARARVARR